MPARNTMDMSHDCPGHLGRIHMHQVRVEAEERVAKRPKRTMATSNRMEAVPGVPAGVVGDFRVQAFKTIFIGSDIKNPYERFVFAMEQSLQPIRDPGLLKCWQDMYLQQPAKGQRKAI